LPTWEPFVNPNPAEPASRQPARTDPAKPPRPTAVIVLAAGEGKRMRSAVPKVLHPLLGRSLVGHVLAAVAPLGAERTLVVIGHGRDQVAGHLAEIAPDAVPVVQAEQFGTGHAVRVALDAKPGAEAGTVVVVNGDAPLLTAQTLAGLLAAHESAGNAVTLLAADLDDPTGYGRVLTDAAGRVSGIVEHRDATAEQQAVRTVNAGLYAFDGPALRDALARVRRHNSQGEEYLTDCVGLLVGDGKRVGAYTVADPTDVLGANDRVELVRLRTVLRDRINESWMRAGVTMIDPATTWIDVTVALAPDVIVQPGTQLQGATVIDTGAEVGPDTTLVDTAVGPDARVVRSHCLGARIGPGCSVGPYAYLRPGAVLARAAKVGTFVEVKASEIGEGSKVPHLTYVGDATIGEHSNIGAASVFVNYDGVAKHRTEVGSHCRTGSDTMFVAPVTIGDGAYTAAGSVITDNVPPGAMAVARSRQRTIPGWVQRRRPGSPAAEAAARALASGGVPTAGDSE
jgi:bifunctional UDP-N-acetylglucosamine pyrophosphorylase/glucosamine-1-phosphate N-acetyltransferase